MTFSQTLYGQFGSAVHLDMPPSTQAKPHATLSTWLITAPQYHPLWSQYNLGMVHLRDEDGLGPPQRLDFAGATHELLVFALNPDKGPYDEADFARFAVEGGMPYLTPQNIGLQFEMSDTEAVDLAEWAIKGVVHGALNPETADAPERIRELWKGSMVKTLAHMRGEAHAPHYTAVPPTVLS